MGWVGTASDLAYTLKELQADTDQEGVFRTSGHIFSFLGLGDEYVLEDDVMFFKDGEPQPLIEALVAAGRGSQVHVVGG